MAAINKALSEVLESVSKKKAKAFLKPFKAGATKLDDLGEAELNRLSRSFTDRLKSGGGGKVDDIARSYIDEVYQAERNNVLNSSSYQRRLARKENSRLARQQFNENINAGLNSDEAIAISRLDKGDLIENRALQQNFSPKQIKQINDDFEFASSIDPSVNKSSIIDDYRNQQKKAQEARAKKFEDGIARSKEYQKEFGPVDPSNLKNWKTGMSDADMRTQAAQEAAATAEATRSAGKKSVETETVRKASKKEGGIYDYVYNREASKYDYENIKKGFTDNDELRKHVSGLTGKSVDDLGSDEAMEAALSATLHQRASNPNWMDKAGYRKYPQLAAGIGTTAWLVSRLSESKGQMSNAQLYGQQPY